MSYQTKLVMCEMLNLLNAKDKTNLRSYQMNYIDATKEQTKLAQDYNTAKAAISASYDQDDPERKEALEDLKDQFEFLKAEAMDYQNEAEQSVDELKETIEMRQTLIDNYKDQIPDEVQRSHQYGFNNG